MRSSGVLDCYKIVCAFRLLIIFVYFGVLDSATYARKTLGEFSLNSRGVLASPKSLLSKPVRTQASSANVSNIKLCDQFLGLDAGVKIANCIADLPPTGGIADARGLLGNQTISAQLSITKANVTLLLGSTVFTLDAPLSITSTNVNIIGVGRSGTIFNYTGSATAIDLSGATRITLDGFRLQKPLGVARIGIGATSSSISQGNYIFRNMEVVGGNGNGFTKCLVFGNGGNGASEISMYDVEIHPAARTVPNIGISIESNQSVNLNLHSVSVTDGYVGIDNSAQPAHQGTFNVYGGNFGRNALADVRLATNDAVPVNIYGAYTEGSDRFMVSAGPDSGSGRPVTIDGLLISSIVNADRAAIVWRGGGPLTVRNSTFGSESRDTGFKVNFNSGSNGRLILEANSFGNGATDTPWTIGRLDELITRGNRYHTGTAWDSIPDQPRVRVSRAESVSVPNAVALPLSWSTEDFDVESFHDLSTNPTRLTIPNGRRGLYQITAVVLWDSAAYGARSASIRKNGIVISEVAGQSPALMPLSQVVTTVDNALAGDYYEVYVSQTTGASIAIAGGSAKSFFSVVRLGN